MAAGLWLAVAACLQPPAPEVGVGGAVASLLQPAQEQPSSGAGDDQLRCLAVGADGPVSVALRWPARRTQGAGTVPRGCRLGCGPGAAVVIWASGGPGSLAPAAQLP